MTESGRAFRAFLRNEFAVGRDARRGVVSYLSLDVLISTALHIIGASGYGKSFFLRLLIDWLIEQRLPFGLIDPHSDLFSYALHSARRSGHRPKDLVVIDPTDERFAVAFNPLCCGVDDPADAASLVVEAFQTAFRQQSMDATPRLESMTRGMAHFLSAGKLTLLQAFQFLDVDNVAFRRALRDRVDDELVRQDWVAFEQLSRAEKLAVTESTRNRLRRFLQSPAIQRMLGQTERALNLYRVLEDGQTLLVNLGKLQSPETQRLLGSLLVNGLYHAAKRRNPGRAKPWFLIIDEAGQFATKDLANSLDELRKFGLHLCLAHQRLGQFADSEVLSAVLTNAKARFVFGGLSRADAERMAYELFTGQVTGDRVKHIATATRFRPVSDTFDVETDSWSTSEGRGEASGESIGHVESAQQSAAERYAIDRDQILENPYDEELLLERGLSRGTGTSSSQSRTSTRSLQRSAVRGGSRSCVPITRHEEFREETSRQYVSLPEEWERHIAKIHTLPKREVLVRVFNGPVLHLRTLDIEAQSNERAIEQFKTRCLEQSPYAKPVEAVEREIAERKEAVRLLTEGGQATPRFRAKVRTFRE